MRLFAFIAGLWLVLAAPAHAASFGAPLDDATLAAQRGGFELPNGMQVALSVVTEARVDGQLVLRSTYSLQGNTPTLMVTGPGGAPAAATPTAGNASVQLGANGAPTRVQFNSSGTDITSLVGNALGSMVANRTDNRTIDVATTVNIDLSGATAQNLGSVMPRINDLALSSVAGLVH